MTWLKQKPQLSIIIPCYNVAEHIENRAYEMPPAPEKSGIEVVLVSDGADRETVGAIARADATLNQKNIPCNALYLKQNVGTLKAEYAGLQTATGRYVYFHDADDPFNPKLIAELLSLMPSAGIHLAAPTRLVSDGKLTDVIWHSRTGPAENVLQYQLAQEHGCISRRSAFDRKMLLREYQLLISELDAAGIGPINAVQDSVVITWLLGRGIFNAVRETTEPYWYTADNPASMSRDPERRKRDIAVLMAVTRWAVEEIHGGHVPLRRYLNLTKAGLL